MAMEHKAYVFEWAAFEAELAPLLYAALDSCECAGLAAFVDGQRTRLTDPDEGDPLPEDWRALAETWDAHRLGDLALTRYYRADAVAGLGCAWAACSDRATEEIEAALLGAPFGPDTNRFDPGKYGSYFQTSQRVRRSLAVLAHLDRPGLGQYRDTLARAARDGRGIYVTF